MKSILIRLDDACEYDNQIKWQRIEQILDRYDVKPLVGIIPNYGDKGLKSNGTDLDFWNRAKKWQSKNWSIALHGYDHVCITHESGINPINNASEFAGVDYKIQSWKIVEGQKILHEHGLKPIAFFAPLHTFDNNTLKALEHESNIRIISDTVASKPYKKDKFAFFPLQTSHPHWLPVSFLSICLHPNNMSDDSFRQLEEFLKKHSKRCVSLIDYPLPTRSMGFIDKTYSKFYFLSKKMKRFWSKK